MDTWPDDGSPVTAEQLVEPICEAIRFAYQLRRQNSDQDIPYTGFEIGQDALANCMPARVQLSAQQLAYSEHDQGRDALTEIVGLAIRIGIEQGRRIATSNSYRIMNLLAEAATLLATRSK